MGEFVSTFFADYGLLALFVLMVLDNIGVPFPSEIPLLLAGLSVSEGTMAFVPAVIVAGAGSLGGALVLYIAGRTIGRAVVLRWGRAFRITHADLDRAEAWFHRRGEATVFFLRVVPLARTLISIPAGMLEMSATRFAAYTAAGSLLWSGAIIGAGWGLGRSYESILGGFDLASLAAASTIGMLIAIWLIKRFLDRRAAERPPQPARPAPEQETPPEQDHP